MTQVISLPSEDGTVRDVYSRPPGGSWFPIHYVPPENMTIEERRKEIQKLADAHRNVARCHVNFGRRFHPKGKLPPEGQKEPDWLIRAEVQARAEYIAAVTGWLEPVDVKPTR